ncbi:MULTISPECIES: LysR substrate-binding domain-containing protein [Delftia]|jgi:LysR family glycine cleavage system transcriptional activator|uniref:LysR substrate-binding domain-containing protein n=1 Tax=Delftia TaxID=80865 RepID=UPI000929CA3A|nr:MULTISPECIES: LysR substrate-binding domain-containing protein [Delftia]OJX21749.1 MAG: hypothetical protein BGO79_26520 [Delftia sp. 67-8]QFS66158.1 hypothetical protein GCS91_18450 [Delftia tsuruhatensis]WEL96790.1 LysR substrate-binding domain-containing protein [Delftia tsuruhatensis]
MAHRLQGLCDGVPLNLSPYVRSQIAEHVDWSVWLAHHRLDREAGLPGGGHYFNANDYNLLIPMVLSDQGVALGWDHLVSPLIARGLLIRPVLQELVLEESSHYLLCREDKANEHAMGCFLSWFLKRGGLAARG